jgi:hypothetical protein
MLIDGVRPVIRIRLWRALALGSCLAAALHPIVPRAQTPTGCAVTGTIRGARQPLPGVVVTLQFDVPASSLKPGLYTCQINVIDDSAGSFMFPRLQLYVRR